MGGRLTLFGLAVAIALCAPLVPAEAALGGGRKSALRKLEEGDAIRNRRLLRGGRFELTPAFGVTLNDAFQRNLLVGGHMAYHLTDEWSVGATGFLGVGLQTSLAEEVDHQRPEKVDGDDAFSSLGYLASIDVYYTPIIGKFALFGRHVLNYDFHVLFGMGAAQVSGVPEVEKLAIAPVLGLGIRTFANDYLAVNVELRDYIYSSALNAVTQKDADGEEDVDTSSGISNTFAVIIGVSLYLPQRPKLSD